MRNSQISNITDLTEQELVTKARELRQQLFLFRLEKATARLEKTHKIKLTRKEIARCETRLTHLAGIKEEKIA